MKRLSLPIKLVLLAGVLAAAGYGVVSLFSGGELPSTTATVAPTAADTSAEDQPARTYRIVTVLPPDAIPAILNPRFLTAGEAQEAYDSDEMVLGLSINGEHRAYSIPFLASHEIVNDVVGGVPLAVTW